MNAVAPGEDEYYYQIELTNKKLIFYFAAGALALVLSFLAGVMVGRGADGPRNTVAEAARAEERIVAEPSVDAAAAAMIAPSPSASPEDLTYTERLESARVDDTLDRPAVARPRPTPAAKPTPSPRARPTPTARPAAAAPIATAAAKGTFSVQVGAFQDRGTAESVAGRLKGRGFPAFVSPGGVAGLWNVRVGTYRARPEAERARDRLKNAEKLSPFIITN